MKPNPNTPFSFVPPTTRPLWTVSCSPANERHKRTPLTLQKASEIWQHPTQFSQKQTQPNIPAFRSTTGIGHRSTLHQRYRQLGGTSLSTLEICLNVISISNLATMVRSSTVSITGLTTLHLVIASFSSLVRSEVPPSAPVQKKRDARHRSISRGHHRQMNMLPQSNSIWSLSKRLKSLYVNTPRIKRSETSPYGAVHLQNTAPTKVPKRRSRSRVQPQDANAVKQCEAGALHMLFRLTERQRTVSTNHPSREPRKWTLLLALDSLSLASFTPRFAC